MTTDEANRGLGRGELALLAHEVRGALTVIVGMSELLRSDLAPAERLRALDGISRAVDRIDRLVDEAVAGEVAAGHASGLVDLAELAEQVAAEQEAVTGRRVEVTVAERPQVVGSREALERALTNLIDNGLKYSLASAPVEVNISRQGARAVVQIADHGPGISPEDRERIFEPFERAGGGDAPGTGLGLTVVRSVVDAHHGRVGVDERIGGGSVFWIEIPVSRA